MQKPRPPRPSLPRIIKRPMLARAANKKKEPLGERFLVVDCTEQID
jgi:hypothetical protein